MDAWNKITSEYKLQLQWNMHKIFNLFCEVFTHYVLAHLFNILISHIFFKKIENATTILLIKMQLIFVEYLLWNMFYKDFKYINYQIFVYGSSSAWEQYTRLPVSIKIK